MTDNVNELLRYLAEEWTAALIQILESMTDQKPKITWKIASAPGGEDIFWWEQSLNLKEAPLIWVGAPSQTWKELGERTLRAAGIDTVEPADARNTYIEILNQSLSGLAQSLTQRMGAAVTCSKGGECPQAPAGAEWVAVDIVYGDDVRPINIGFGPHLIGALGRAEESIPVAVSADLERGSDFQSGSEPTSLLPHSSKTLDLLLDVELPVSVSFGRAELLLKDVLKLTTGSIVELNRGVSEPVEVIVNNCVVARGEVVVMEGNYGVRIHHIISPQERLRTLK